MTILALDIGATKLAAGRVSPEGGVQDVRRVPVPAVSVWEACSALLSGLAGDEKVERLGIASSGPVDMVNGIAAPLNIPEWQTGFPVAASAQEIFPDASVRFAGDGVCLALAEQQYGAARGVPDSLAITVSSGIGGGFAVGGFVSVGRTGNAGHVGHIVVAGSDEPCACGGSGCVEAIASGPSSVRWAKKQGWSGETGADLATAARKGDKIAVDALARAGTALGQAISSAAAMLDTDLVVVGGGFAQSGPALWDPMRAAVAKHAKLSYLSELRVVPSKLGDMATLVGAGVLVLS